MAWVTVGTARDARIRISSTAYNSDSGTQNIRARWSGVSGYAIYGGSGFLRTVGPYATLASLGKTFTSVAPDVIEFTIIGTTLTVGHINAGKTLATVTDSTFDRVGLWQYNDAYWALESFESLDAPEGYTVDISAGSGGSVSTAQLTSVDDTTGKTFTATPNDGYRIASITPSTGVTVTPAASGQTSATTFTVKATQAGSVLVAFEAIAQTLPAEGSASASAAAIGNAGEVEQAAGTAAAAVTASGSAGIVEKAEGAAVAEATSVGAAAQVLPASGQATASVTAAGAIGAAAPPDRIGSPRRRLAVIDPFTPTRL